ncbi:MAG: hypothetical protein USCAAHI_01666 [Beijerinckiaceae bacterium]|jgi:hypothetical protein|nr:MAG: hypothetical protein USCAAHI_01666 [Beijerinckiaceae bacterium]
MKTIWKKILMGAAILPAGGPAFAQNQPLTCWYNDHADFTSADSAAADARVGAVTRYGSGDKTYNYTISARDGSACPVQLPLSSLTAVTVALVRQDEGSCGNENVVDSGTAAVVGSVTVARSTDESSTAGIRLVGLSPNTSYQIFLKCARQLGTVRTDAAGNAGRTVDFPNDAAGQVYAFEISPEGAPPGTKLQSLSFRK